MLSEAGFEVRTATVDVSSRASVHALAESLSDRLLIAEASVAELKEAAGGGGADARQLLDSLSKRVLRLETAPPSTTGEPAADAVAFDLPPTSGARHRIVATAADGTRAEGYVIEADGLATPEGAGLSISRPLPDPPRPLPSGRPKPVGTTRNGFTKLR